MIDKVGRANLDLMEAVGWLMEKASRFKLQRDESGERIGTLEALETLALGIQGKAALWSALGVIREVDSRVPPNEGRDQGWVFDPPCCAKIRDEGGIGVVEYSCARHNTNDWSPS